MAVHNSPWLKPIPFLMVRCLLLAGLSLLAGARPALAAREPTGSGDGWPEVTAEERGLTRLSQDPEADAVILMNERQGKIVKHGDDWVNSMIYHRRLKVLSDKGKEHGEVRIRASKGSRVSNVQARTIKADGTIVPVASDQIFEKVVEQIGSFKRTEWVFNFPAVDVGAILEYRYERNDNYFVYLDPWYFEGEAYTLRSRVAQAIPGGMGYAVLCDLCPGDVKPTITDWREAKERGQLYSMELRDLPGYREEGLMPPRREVSPHMEMVLQTWKNFMDPALGRQDRFFIDWDSVARYAGYYYDRAIKEGQSALKPIVDGWIQGMADPDQKVKGIVRHVEDDFRYIDFLNVGGSARPIASILKEKNADNEEKAVLLIAALKTAGIEARPALIVGKDYGSLNPKFFSFSQFTHTVAALPRPDGSYQWIDPTVSYAPFGFVPWKDSGAGALLIEGPKGTLLDLPVKTELNTTRYRVNVRPRTDGKVDLEIEAEYSGEDAIDMREELLPAGEESRKSYLQDWLKKARRGAALASYSIDNLGDLEKPLKIAMKAEAPDLITVAEGVLLVRGCVLFCRDSNPVSHVARQNPLYIDRGWNEEEAVVIQPPPGMSAAPTPAPVMARSTAANLNFSCSSQSDESVRCVRQFIARRNRWPAAELVNVRAMFDKIIEADRTAVAFQKTGSAAGT